MIIGLEGNGNSVDLALQVHCADGADQANVVVNNETCSFVLKLFQASEDIAAGVDHNIRLLALQLSCGGRSPGVSTVCPFKSSRERISMGSSASWAMVLLTW